MVVGTCSSTKSFHSWVFVILGLTSDHPNVAIKIDYIDNIFYDDPYTLIYTHFQNTL